MTSRSHTGRAGSTGMQTPSPGTRADSTEETVRGFQPRECGSDQEMRAGVEMAAGQDADPDISPIMKWKRAGSNRPR